MFLEVKKLKKYYGDGDQKRCVLNDMAFSVDKGEICVILGPSGSGKSTALNIVGGLETLDDGDVLIDGENLNSISDKKLEEYRRDNIGFVFQSYNLIPNLTVRENIEVCEFLGQDTLNIDELLKSLGLSEHMHKFPKHLSGGQQQRTAIARALVKNPKLLLCDEPTGALDYETSKETLKLLESINKKYGTTMLIVTHNEAISQMANKVLKVRDGKIKEVKINKNPLKAEEINW